MTELEARSVMLAPGRPSGTPGTLKTPGLDYCVITQDVSYCMWTETGLCLYVDLVLIWFGSVWTASGFRGFGSGSGSGWGLGLDLVQLWFGSDLEQVRIWFRSGQSLVSVWFWFESALYEPVWTARFCVSLVDLDVVEVWFFPVWTGLDTGFVTWFRSGLTLI